MTTSRFVWAGDDVEFGPPPADLSKGDYVGHPFRGNQWTDSSGSGRGVASSATAVAEHQYGGMFRAEISDDYTWSVDEQGMVDFLSRQHGGKPFDEAHASALIDYQSEMWYEDINNALRAGLADDVGVDEYLAGLKPTDATRIRSDIKLIDESFETASLDEDTIVFRGLDDQEGWYRNAVVGDIISDAAYQSTTLNPIVATMFAEGIGGQTMARSQQPVLMRIRVPKGFPAIALESATGLLHDPVWIKEIKEAQGKDGEGNREDGYTVGSEILLPRWTGYEVKGWSEVDDGKVLDVEVFNGHP